MGRKAIIFIFVLLYLSTSILSTIHVIDFFRLSNSEWLAISLAVAFEIGAAASLASLAILEKINKTVVWAIFIVLTLFQVQGNVYHSFTHLHDYNSWIELFGLTEQEPIFQKRIIAIVSGAILPLIALGFIKSLVDYIKPEQIVQTKANTVESAETRIDNLEPVFEAEAAQDIINKPIEHGKTAESHVIRDTKLSRGEENQNQ